MAIRMSIGINELIQIPAQLLRKDKNSHCYVTAATHDSSLE